MAYRVKNWAEFQHYDKRTPPWIKLHRQLLDDRQWASLSDGASKMLVECWLVASQGKTPGEIVENDEGISWRLRRPLSKTVAYLQELVAAGFIERCEQDASELLASCKQDAMLETEERQRKRQRERATQLPTDWLPRPEEQQLAGELGIDEPAEREKFRDYWQSEGKPKKDWDATYRGWLRRAAEWKKERTPEVREDPRITRLRSMPGPVPIEEARKRMQRDAPPPKALFNNLDLGRVVP